MFLFSNGLTGPIPSQLGHLGRLTSMDLANNSLSGEIPMELSRLKELRLLHLFKNRLHGGIPSFIGDLPDLVDLGFDQNNFTGFLPRQLSVSEKLLQVYVSDNNLTGSIPPNLCKGGRLEYLYIQNNLLSGPMIPDSLGTCKSLKIVSLRENSLNGAIPAGRILEGSLLSHFNASLFAGNPSLFEAQLGRCGSAHIKLGHFLALSALGFLHFCSFWFLDLQ